MRTINADSLKEELKRWFYAFYNAGMKTEADIVSGAIRRVNAEPTIEPRKKGKWINHRCDDGHHIADCDQCGHSLQWFDDDIPKYCCECGADMRKEVNEQK